jgi:hypothetical protein
MFFRRPFDGVHQIYSKIIWGSASRGIFRDISTVKKITIRKMYLAIQVADLKVTSFMRGKGNSAFGETKI